RFCPNVNISDMSNPKIVEHSGSHIIYDSKLKDKQACGFCLDLELQCKIYLVKRAGVTSINKTKSRCPHLRRGFRIKNALTSTSSRAPCTNHPLTCPLCLLGYPAVWSYNLPSHLASDHPQADPGLQADIYTLTEEEKSEMQKVYARKSREKTVKQTNKLRISNGHSSVNALWYVNLNFKLRLNSRKHNTSGRMK
ncbi:hypothetical protein C8J56DRAFT_784776, partial [Mycena floridula]